MATKLWWRIRECFDWNREMTAHYKAGLEDGRKGCVRKDGLTFQGCYDQGYDHGQRNRNASWSGRRYPNYGKWER